MKPVSPVDKTVVAGADPLPRIGGYTIVRLIGHGGAGRVFAAKDEQLGRTVAIKVLHPQVASDPRNVERFLREARAMATISSPHVAAIYQVGQHKGASFIVMEYLEGENLEQRLRREGQIPLGEALAYARDCALALQAADAAGLVHRDVKPANIVVLGGKAKLTDFGTARPMDGSADMTMEGQIAGTATFMAPERALGKGDDRRADIYSLGATLYCLASGEPPFVRSNPIDIISAHLHEEPPPLHERVPGVSSAVQGLLTRMMAKEPAERFQRYDQLVAAIEGLLGGGGEEGDFEEATEVLALDQLAPAPIPTQRAPLPTPTTSSAVNDPFGPPPSTGGDPFGGPAGGEGDGGMTGVMGTLKQMSIVDICHMLEMGKKDAEIDLAALDGSSGKLCLLGGQVVFATWGELEAEEAFYVLARRTEGFFRIHYGRQTSEQNINAPTAFLILEAMRRLDEASQQQEAAPGPAAPPPPRQPSPDITAPDEAPVGSWSDPFETSGTGPPSPPSMESLPVPPVAPHKPPPIRPSAPVRSRTGPQSPAPVALPKAPPEAPPPMPRRAHSGRSDTLLMSPEDEAALRAEGGREVPLGQRLERLVEVGSEHLRTFSAQILSPTSRQLAAALEARPSLAALAPPLRRRPWLLAAAPVAALLVGVLCAALVAALLSPSGVDGAALARIERGEAPLVLAELEEKPALDRTAQDELLRGHALAELERTDEALEAYRSAAGLGVTDERAVQLALDQLSEQEPLTAIDLLAQVPSAEVTRLLLQRGMRDEWNTRHNAVRALEARGELEQVDLEALAIRDVLEGPACMQRREGLLALKKYGKSEAARDAFQQAYARKNEGNSCMSRELEEMAPK